MSDTTPAERAEQLITTASEEASGEPFASPENWSMAHWTQVFGERLDNQEIGKSGQARVQMETDTLRATLAKIIQEAEDRGWRAGVTFAAELCESEADSMPGSPEEEAALRAMAKTLAVNAKEGPPND